MANTMPYPLGRWRHSIRASCALFICTHTLRTGTLYTQHCALRAARAARAARTLRTRLRTRLRTPHCALLPPHLHFHHALPPRARHHALRTAPATLRCLSYGTVSDVV